ncbi:hypothetical protein V5799_011677 [Amblyomma americanum]|uniref:Uncharacterized protein n=1 Tax=Amblyomma americanum TaxID=6943 RepID=A0AAQ4EG72_AMBAM
MNKQLLTKVVTNVRRHSEERQKNLYIDFDELVNNVKSFYFSFQYKKSRLDHLEHCLLLLRPVPSLPVTRKSGRDIVCARPTSARNEQS